MGEKHQKLIEDYLSGCQALREATQGMSPEELKARPVPGKWSTLEVVCHLADFEPVFADRMKRVIALENPVLLGADENEFARHLAYGERDFKEELALMELVRSQMARILKGIPGHTWEKKGMHSERGPISLENLLEKSIGHFRHHLPFIAEKRRVLAAKITS